MQGLIFDIKEFALHDGAGIRTTVFLKGCPLRCIWCHNPEGLRPVPELMAKTVGCLQCQLCRRPCRHPECQPFGRCLHICPKGLVKTVGTYMESEALVARLMRGKEAFDASGGGVTFSGGEPLLQADFVCEVAERLSVHRLLETSGYADFDTFRRVISHMDTVYMDVKLADPAAHRQYTGVDNAQILENLAYLKHSGKDFLIRVPLIPDITDTEENLRAISALVGDAPVELLSYNPLAPAKYASVGRTFTDRITKKENRPVELSLFQNATWKR